MAAAATVLLATFLEKTDMLQDNFHYDINKFSQQILENFLNLN